MFFNYVGTKIIKAKLASLEEYNILKKKDISEKDKSIYGYIVYYPPIGINEDVPYISWSPKEVFEKCYRVIEDCEIKLLEVKNVN
jgi:hypothetical protein